MVETDLEVACPLASWGEVTAGGAAASDAASRPAERFVRKPSQRTKGRKREDRESQERKEDKLSLKEDE